MAKKKTVRKKATKKTPAKKTVAKKSPVKKNRYKVLVGTHSEGGKIYRADGGMNGSIVNSATDLSRFNNPGKQDKFMPLDKPIEIARRELEELEKAEALERQMEEEAAAAEEEEVVEEESTEEEPQEDQAFGMTKAEMLEMDEGALRQLAEDNEVEIPNTVRSVPGIVETLLTVG